MYAYKLKVVFALVLAILPLQALPMNYVGKENVLSLAEIKGVFIIVEGIDEHVTNAGLNEYIFKSAARNALKRASLKDLSEQEMLNTPGRPILYISVNALRNVNDTSYSTEVCLNQLVVLQRSSEHLVHVPTWAIKSSGLANNYVAGQEILEYISLSLDKFVEAIQNSK